MEGWEYCMITLSFRCDLIENNPAAFEGCYSPFFTLKFWWTFSEVYYCLRKDCSQSKCLENESTLILQFHPLFFVLLGVVQVTAALIAPFCALIIHIHTPAPITSLYDVAISQKPKSSYWYKWEQIFYRQWAWALLHLRDGSLGITRGVWIPTTGHQVGFCFWVPVKEVMFLGKRRGETKDSGDLNLDHAAILLRNLGGPKSLKGSYVSWKWGKVREIRNFQHTNITITNICIRLSGVQKCFIWIVFVKFVRKVSFPFCSWEEVVVWGHLVRSWQMGREWQTGKILISQLSLLLCKPMHAFTEMC